ncbi:MAG: HisA/HisF-related TIM barrel protein [Candidatus Hodarchaeota archaeon]
MKIIPVLDIKGSKVVRGLAGRRDEYAPLRKTVLLAPSEACEPTLLLRAFEEIFGFKEFYVADIDSIEGRESNLNVLRSLRDVTDAKILLDAGIRTKADFEAIPNGFTAVIASETLQNHALISDLVKNHGSEVVWFSLDLKKGNLLAPKNTNLPSLPLEAATIAAQSGIAGLIAIELDRVGGKTGPNFSLVQNLANNLSIPVYWGGGVRHLQDLLELQSLNCSGCLVASALHSGVITAEELLNINK